MSAKTPKHGTKKEIIEQPAQVLTFIPDKSKNANKTGGYKLKKAA